MRYYLGLDAGGTKTFCLVGSEEGRILGFGRGATGNYESYGIDAATDEIRKAVNGALGEAGLTMDQISGIGMGIAGADVPDDYVMLEREIFTPLMGSVPRCFRNDSMAGLRGGTREPKGIVIACGTGCVSAGVNAQGRECRAGGINEEYGDKVSGTSIGLEGLRSVFRARENICEPTALTPLFLERSGCANPDELFHRMYRGEVHPRQFEPMAKLVFQAAFEGDRVACDILEESGRYLGQMVNGVARTLDMCQDEFEVVMAGGVFKGKSPVLKDSMATVIHRVCPLARLTMPVFEPVVGALLLGMELELKVTDTIYTAMSGELSNAEDRYQVRFKTE
jgi:N-acetylglucosamine kinase-like BadF-type ATPase